MLDAFFPLTLLAFEAVGVRYWNTIFSNQARWLFLAVLLIVVLIRGDIRNLFNGKASTLFLLAYLMWCVCTAVWSEIPELSFLKAAALIMTVVAFFNAGQGWNYRNPTLNFLLPIAVLALFAGLFDRGAGQEAGSIRIYEGLAGNPNYLGAVAAMSVPYAIWQVYRNRSKPFRRWAAIGATVAIVGVVVLSGSRAAALFVLAIALMFVMALKPGRRFMVITLVGALGLGTAIAVPAVKSALYERFLFKGDEEGRVLLTRQDVWGDSYDQALKGGMLGGGYGVTVGAPADFSLAEMGLTAVGYGREKGNSQLAIWEETGLIGLGFYALFILAITLELASGFRRIRDRDSKIQLGLLFGAVIGILLQSIFEGWWVAPGSAESAFFWATLGAAYGTLRRATVRHQNVRANFRPRIRRQALSVPAAS